MEINVKELDIQPVFDNKFYDTILAAARLMFGNHAVTAAVNDYRVYIKKNINLTLIFSANEPKVYIDTYIGRGLDTENYVMLYKNNTSFRLFDIDSVIKYLQIKWQEDLFIHQNSY